MDHPVSYTHLKGIKASYEGHTYWVGSHKLLKDFSATVSDVMAEMLVHYESDGNGLSLIHI